VAGVAAKRTMILLDLHQRRDSQGRVYFGNLAQVH
jgi:hypothetical protein